MLPQWHIWAIKKFKYLVLLNEKYRFSRFLSGSHLMIEVEVTFILRSCHRVISSIDGGVQTLPWVYRYGSNIPRGVFDLLNQLINMNGNQFINLNTTVALNMSSNWDCHDSDVGKIISVVCAPVVVHVVVLVGVNLIVVVVEFGKIIVSSPIVVKLNDENSCSYKKMSNGSK